MCWLQDDLQKSGLVVDDFPFEPTKEPNGYRIYYTNPATGSHLIVQGEPYYRVKLKNPLLSERGKKIKYIAPKQSGVHIFYASGVYDFYRENSSLPLLITEGEKKALCATKHGLPCVGISGINSWNVESGNKSINPELAPLFKNGRDVIMIYDSDMASKQIKNERNFINNNKALAKALLEYGSRLDIVILPENGQLKVGVDDFIVKHGVETLKHEIELRKTFIEPEFGEFILPDGEITRSDFAKDFFLRCKFKQLLFRRGDSVFQMRDKNLKAVKKGNFMTFPEYVGELKKRRFIEGVPVLRPASILQSEATALAESPEMYVLDNISQICTNPIAVKSGNQYVELSCGYNRILNGIYVTGNEHLKRVDSKEASESLEALISDFNFSEPADKSRMLAAFITPALRMGKFIDYKCPILMFQANQSQAGKGHATYMIASLYDEEMIDVKQRGMGGVGSTDESIDSAIVTGKPFIRLDNLKREMKSSALDSILTSNGSHQARVAYLGYVECDISKTVWFATTNGVNMDTDLANRCCIINFEKQPHGYKYKSFNGKDVITHIKDNSSHYRSCVYSLVREWFKDGAKRINIGHHDFSDWAGAVTAIIKQNWPHLPSVLEGHSDVQNISVNPSLVFARKLCDIVARRDLLNEPLRMYEICEICYREGIDIPDTPRSKINPENMKSIAQTMGYMLKSLVGDYDKVIKVGRFTMERTRKLIRRKENNTGLSQGTKQTTVLIIRSEKVKNPF